MKTIIETLKEKQPAANPGLLEEVEELREEVEDKENEIEELKEKHEEYAGGSYYTGLGEIIVINKSGNLQLQQELNDFFELLQQKYL